MERMARLSVVVLLTAGMAPRFVAAQEAASGPFSRLVLRGGMIVPGHGGPAYGPADVVIEDDTIVQIRSVASTDAERAAGERVIDVSGMYVLPGLVDLHCHVRTEPLPLEYVYFMKLAHGVTTIVNGSERGFEAALEEARRSEANEIAAPRMYPIRDWGPARSRDPGHAPPLDEIRPWHDPERAEELAAELIGGGAHVVRIGSLAWNPDLFGAVARAVYEAGGITTVHLPPSDIAATPAVRAAELGVTMIEHHYGYAESSFAERVQRFPDDYNYNDELHRFRHAGTVWRQADPERLFGEVVDRLVASGVAMVPTMNVYEANRDIVRAMGLGWHRKYAHRQLIEWFYPSRIHHGAYHWDWTSADEADWAEAYRLWQRLVREFQDRGGLLAYGSDDPYIWAPSGIANVRELELMQEAGLHPLEVLRAASRSAALTLRRPDLGLVQTGYKADLFVVDGNPLHNLRFLFPFGALTLERGEMVRKGGVRWTIKDGVVYDNHVLVANVLRMVEESKRGWSDPVEALFEPLH